MYYRTWYWWRGQCPLPLFWVFQFVSQTKNFLLWQQYASFFCPALPPFEVVRHDPIVYCSWLAIHRSFESCLAASLVWMWYIHTQQPAECGSYGPIVMRKQRGVGQWRSRNNFTAKKVQISNLP